MDRRDGGSSLVISAILAAIFFARERQARVEAALERERTRAERVEREAALATLRALQAQIEPHFLFNTLANVASLIDSDPALSKRMLERFIRFLRASLAATREETTTLADEGDLIDAYLDVMEVRMASRMRTR
jgi:sensor histidine kinase YesM